MDIEQFFTKIANVKDEMNKFLNGEKGPLKDINDGISRLDNKIKEAETIRNKKSDELTYLHNPTQQEDLMNAMVFGLQFAIAKRFMDPSKELSDEDKKRIDTLETEIIHYNDELAVLNKNKELMITKKNDIISNYKKLENLYFYSHIFDVDMKNAGSIEKLSDLLCKFNENTNILIEKKIDENNDIIKEDFNTTIKNTRKEINELFDKYKKEIDDIIETLPVKKD